MSPLSVAGLGLIFQDVRVAVRALRKAPAFAVASILTIALGIAANASVFSVVDAALLRSLPFPEPERLAQVSERNETLNIPISYVSTLNYQSWTQQSRTFEALGAFGSDAFTITGGGEPEQVPGGAVSPSLVPLLRLRPLAGRAFHPGEDAAGSPRVVMLGEALWKRRFAGDPAAVGRSIAVNGTPSTIVGVMGPELTRLTGSDLWVPMVIDLAHENRLSHTIAVVGRLRPGITIDAAQAEMDVIGRRVVAQFPDVRGWTIGVRSLGDSLVSGGRRTALQVLMGAVVLVLLIVCANVANLLLARTAARQKEIAIRAALGAGRARLAWELLTEGLLLALAGGLTGLLLATAAVALFNTLPAGQQPITGVRIDATVCWFTFLASLASGLVFGLAPAWHGAGSDLGTALKQGDRSSRSPARPLLRNGQAAAQLAFATVLAVAAALLAQSLARLQAVPLGFDPSGALTFRLSPPASKYPDHASGWAFYKQALAALEGVPGVSRVAISSGLPFLGGGYTRTPVTTPNRSPLPAGTAVPIHWRVVSPGYFRTLGIPLLRGRDFSEHDTPDGAPVVVVSAAMARRFWGADDPIGKTVHLENARGRQKADYAVVGVVGDVRSVSLDEEPPAMYYSSSFRLRPTMEFVVRAAGSPDATLPALRARIRQLDPELPLAAVKTLEQGISDSASQPRFNAVLLIVCAAVALAIAGIGVYGVLAYSVSHRTREIGLRMALGAERRAVMGLVLLEGMKVSLAGLAVGLAAAAAASRVLTSLLFGIEAGDPLTFAAAAFVLAGIAAIACAAPAWRASRVDPIVALRSE